MKKLAVLIAFLSTAANAATTDFAQPLRNADGVVYAECVKYDEPKPPEKPKCVETKAVTLGAFVKLALDSRHGDVEAQKAAYRLLKSLDEKKPIELTTDQMQIIRDAIWAFRESMHSRGVDIPLAEAGAAVEMINPADMK